jgi:plastocyanin
MMKSARVVLILAGMVLLGAFAAFAAPASAEISHVFAIEPMPNNGPALDDDDQDRGHPERPFQYKAQRLAPKPAGTEETTRMFFGPYEVLPGHDENRVDLDLPLQDGYITMVTPHLRRSSDLSAISHQEAHIHHAHWFALDPGNEEDNYTYGNTEWIFGTGDEETRADFSARSAADPTGPIYGQYIGKGGPQLMIYMLHNKTSQPLNVWMVLDVTFIHGTKAELKDQGGRPFHDITGVLFGRTFDVPRNPKGTGEFLTSAMKQGPIEWTATHDGTLIGTGGHLHPGGERVIVENLGTKESPCALTKGAYAGTLLLRSDANWRNNVPFSEDFQMEVTNPAWRAPIKKGDRLRITGVYENKEHAWYTAMTHEGVYVDEAQAPVGHCAPYLINQPTPAGSATRVKKRVVTYKQVKVKRHGKTSTRRVRVVKDVWVKKKLKGKPVDPTEGVLSRPWGKHVDRVCGEQYGAPPCEHAEPARPDGALASQVHIADFLYVPGDRSLSGANGSPPQVKQGTSLQFINDDVSAGIRHSVTTCAWPCNGTYVANYPLANGVWDSTTLGYDAVDGGNMNPVAQTPTDLPAGMYSYFCRIHPWMRGAFQVIQ